MKLKLKMEMGMEAGVLQNKQRARSWERQAVATTLL
jgi:hypothetical protein